MTPAGLSVRTTMEELMRDHAGGLAAPSRPLWERMAPGSPASPASGVTSERAARPSAFATAAFAEHRTGHGLSTLPRGWLGPSSPSMVIPGKQSATRDPLAPSAAATTRRRAPRSLHVVPVSTSPFVIPGKAQPRPGTGEPQSLPLLAKHLRDRPRLSDPGSARCAVREDYGEVCENDWKNAFEHADRLSSP